MRNLTNTLRTIFAGLLIFALAVSCQQNGAASLTGPDSASNATSHEIASNDIILNTNQGEFKVLQVRPGLKSAAALHKGGEDTVFTKTQYIKAEDGGFIILGNWDYGFSTISFGRNELPPSDSIFFEWAPQTTFDGMMNGLEFGPHGTQFNGPVTVTLSYQAADLTGVNQEDLKIAYFNENTGEWEIQQTHVNKWMKTVVVYLQHFSRYALVHGVR